MSLLANCKSIFWIQQSSWFLRYAKDATITTRDIASRSLHTANWTSDANQHDATARPLYSVYEFCFHAVSRLISSDTRVRSFSLSTPPKVKSLKSEEIQWIISVFVLEYIRRTATSRRRQQSCCQNNCFFCGFVATCCSLGNPNKEIHYRVVHSANHTLAHWHSYVSITTENTERLLLL